MASGTRDLLEPAGPHADSAIAEASLVLGCRGLMKLHRAALLLAFLLGCEPAPAVAPPAPTASATAAASAPPPSFPPGWPYPADAPKVTGEHGMVVTDAALATRVGVEVLRSGGNAVDAAVATAFALAVVYPGAGNIGGGGFMVARVDGQAHALDFRETAPAAASHDMFKTKAEKGGDSRVGHLAAGVPGSVAGLWEAHQKLGSKKKTWAELIAPSIKLAEEGFVVDAEFTRSVGQNEKRLAQFPASASLFLPGGKPVAEGSTWKNPELGAALRRIAEKGPQGFYEGPTAELIAAEMQRGGGLITKADLAAYKAKWRTPIETTYRGHKIIGMPPPSSGGLTVGMIAHILEGYDLPHMAWHSPGELHLVFEAMRRAFVARNEKLGDPDFVKNPTDLLMSPEWAATQRAGIKPDRATPTSEIAPPPSSVGGAGPHTTHFSVVDDKGNAVALTTTINLFYGSGVTVTGAGFLLNDEMDDFATVPGTPNVFGLVMGEVNSVAPGKRMLSSMSPTIVVNDKGRTELVLGAAGGPTIITAVFWELSNVLDHGLSLTAATNAPRFHEQGLPDVVMFEKGGIADTERKALEAMGYTFKDREHIADAPAIGLSSNVWVGAAEPRRKGALAAGY
ncbi:Gamma-glutamyltranspeptidase [Minicystis rosea]|nr:Gamma-glutamyltranspeptidase [Minicystis rosea]